MTKPPIVPIQVTPAEPPANIGAVISFAAPWKTKASRFTPPNGGTSTITAGAPIRSPNSPSPRSSSVLAQHFKSDFDVVRQRRRNDHFGITYRVRHSQFQRMQRDAIN